MSHKCGMAAPTRETRRTPRLPARCSTEVRFGAGLWTGLTDDLGAGGCRIEARFALRPGEPVSLKLRFGGVRDALDVVGMVAWTTPKPPWTTGVAFARGQEDKARRFVRAVLAAAPTLAEAQPPEPGDRAPRPPPPVASPAPEPLLAPRSGGLDALLLAARALAAGGSHEEAIRLLREALERDPGNFRAIALLRALGADQG